MSDTIKHSWKEKDQVIVNKTLHGSSNPWVGSFLDEFRSEAEEELDDAFYATAYLIGEYGEEAIEAVTEMSEEERREYVVDIEDRLYKDRQPNRASQNVLTDKED